MKLLFGIDVEEWFQVENLSHVINRNTWDSRESRIEKNVEKVLSILSKKNVKSTFFVVGCIAEKFPSLMKKIYSQGH